MLLIMLILLNSFLLKNNDMILLNKTLTSECSICTEEEKYLIISVILNRIENEKFPNTIQGVIFQKNQFKGTKTKWFKESLKSQKTINTFFKYKKRNKHVLFFFKYKKNNIFIKRMENRIIIKNKNFYHVFAK